MLKAVRVLREHIDRNYEGSITAFARVKDFDVSELARILRGERGARMSVRLALAIQAATMDAAPTVEVSFWAEEE